MCNVGLREREGVERVLKTEMEGGRWGGGGGGGGADCYSYFFIFSPTLFNVKRLVLQKSRHSRNLPLLSLL